MSILDWNFMTIDIEEKTTASWLKEAQKGYIRVAVLILLNKKPSHGYEIMKEIKNRTKGFWKPTPGGVYPILQKLEEKDYIEGKWGSQKNRKIKIYHITESGKVILQRAIIKQNEIANNVNSLFQEFARDVLNVEPQMFPMPLMNNPFSAFLEEETAQKAADFEELERQRKHLKEVIDTLQQKLTCVDKELAKAKKKPAKTG